MKVVIVHVPYKHRGGEDVHVDALAQGYQRIGVTPIFYPQDRTPPRSFFSRSLWSLAPAATVPELERLWQEEKPAYIHLHNVFPILGPRFFRWAIARKIPLVMTVHNHRFFCTNGLALRDKKICKDCFTSKVAWRPILHNCNQSWKKSIYHSLALTELRLEDLYSRAIQRFVAPSPYLQAELVRLGIPKDRVVHILNPVVRVGGDASPRKKDARSAAESHGSHGSHDVIYAGRLSQEKGINELIAAIRLLPEVRFLIVGDGPERPLIEAGVTELKNMSYLGAVSHERVLDLIGQSRIAVLPSICNETLSTFALEAFFEGKRCVVPALDSTSWLASGDFPGHLARAGEPSDLARAIQAALASPSISPNQQKNLQNRLGFNRFCNDLDALIKGMQI